MERMGPVMDPIPISPESGVNAAGPDLFLAVCGVCLLLFFVIIILLWVLKVLTISKRKDPKGREVDVKVTTPSGGAPSPAQVERFKEEAKELEIFRSDPLEYRKRVNALMRDHGMKPVERSGSRFYSKTIMMKKSLGTNGKVRTKGRVVTNRDGQRTVEDFGGDENIGPYRKGKRAAGYRTAGMKGEPDMAGDGAIDVEARDVEVDEVRSGSKEDLVIERIMELKEMWEAGDIDRAEYERKKDELVDRYS